jgi:hypothetical protein
MLSTTTATATATAATTFLHLMRDEQPPRPAGHAVCHLCGGLGEALVCASRRFGLLQRIGCSHCATSGWCACERCVSRFGGLPVPMPGTEAVG